MVDLFEIAQRSQVPQYYRDQFGIEINLDGTSLRTHLQQEYYGQMRMSKMILPPLRRIIVANSFAGEVSPVEVQIKPLYEANDKHLLSDFVIRLAGGFATTLRTESHPIPESEVLQSVATFFTTNIPGLAPHDYLIGTEREYGLLHGWKELIFPAQQLGYQGGYIGVLTGTGVLSKFLISVPSLAGLKA